MKIVILTGGTGSIALQRGLYEAFERHLDGLDLKIIVNAYDNGLSTGEVRRVMEGQILGPSDVRKNQTTRLRLKDPGDPWLALFERRFTCEACHAHDVCKDEINRFLMPIAGRERAVQHRELVIGAIDEFFKRALSRQITYDDFSLANVIYAGLASANGNSLRVTARIMADVLNIPDNVLLNDDKSLYLGAITSSGRRISDEGQIVSWGNEKDPIVDVFFVDPNGADAQPELCLEAWKAIVEADLIILSSGTQWSSLIPTYASRGFSSAIRDSDAMVLMVMNRMPDKDSPGLTASGIVDLLVPRYFDRERLHVLADRHGHPNMRGLRDTVRAKVASYTETEMSGPTDPGDKHDPTRLAQAIGRVFFRDYLDSKFFLFDYDDTLVGRENSYPKSSAFNQKGICWLNGHAQVGICTGNTITAVHLGGNSSLDGQEFHRRPLLVFADGGVNKYVCETQAYTKPTSNTPKLVRCVAPDSLLPMEGPYSASNIVNALVRVGVPASKIENRGNAVIAIKPVVSDERRALKSLLKDIVRGFDLEVRECGRTTVEIRRPTLSKLHSIKHLCDDSNPRQITYVGDECVAGNDRDIQRLSTEGCGVRCLQVDGPCKIAFFISTLISKISDDSH